MYPIRLIFSYLRAFWWDLVAAAEIQVYFLSQEPNLSAVKLSHKLEYACRVLAQLARTHGQEKLAHIDELAEAEKIPANYLVQILNELRNAGTRSSRRWMVTSSSAHSTIKGILENASPVFGAISALNSRKRSAAIRWKLSLWRIPARCITSNSVYLN